MDRVLSYILVGYLLGSCTSTESNEGNSYDDKAEAILEQIKLVNISTEGEKHQGFDDSSLKTQNLDEETMNEQIPQDIRQNSTSIPDRKGNWYKQVDEERREKSLESNQYSELDEKHKEKPNEQETNKNSEKDDIDTKSIGKEDYNDMKISINAAMEQSSKHVTNTANNEIKENNVQLEKHETTAFEDTLKTTKDTVRQPAKLLDVKSYTVKEKETNPGKTEAPNSDPSDSQKVFITNKNQLNQTEEKYVTSMVMKFDKSTKEIHIDKLNVEQNKQQISKTIPRNIESTKTSLFSKSVPESVTNIKKFSSRTTLTNLFPNKSQDIKPRPVSVTNDEDTSLSFKSDSIINKNHEVQKDNNNKTLDSINTEKNKDYELDSIHENHNADSRNIGEKEGKDTDNSMHQTKHTEKQLHKSNEINYKSTSTHRVLLNNPNQYSKGSEDRSISKADPCKEINDLRKQYSSNALIAAAVGGVFIGAVTVFLLFRIKHRCGNYIYGDYRRVPMEYDFELNPRYKAS